MKSKLLFLLLLNFTVLTSAKTVTIKGKINGRLPETLYYTAPVNGTLGFDFYYTSVPDAKGNFEVTINLEQTCFIDFYYNYKPAGCIVVQPGGAYNLDITEKEGTITYIITGNEIEGQKLYTALMAGKHRQTLMIEAAEEALKLDTAEALKADFKKREETDIAALKKLLDTKAISKTFYNAAISERRYFYSAALSYAILMRLMHAERDDTIKNVPQFKELWPQVFTANPPTDKTLQQSPWGVLYLDCYKFQRLYSQAGYDSRKLNEAKPDPLANEKHSEATIPAVHLEYYMAASICLQAAENAKNKELIDRFAYFRKKYPASPYTVYIEPKMAPIISFYAENNTLPANAAYVENYASINTLEELIKKFPGKKLYFDVWATWCGSCREEFKYKEELYKLLKANDITVIYVSVDKDEKDETWRKMIAYYGLQGYHIRTNNALDSSVSHAFSGNGGISLPWYFLVNGKGETVVKYAAPPSEIAKLEADIKKLN